MSKCHITAFGKETRILLYCYKSFASYCVTQLDTDTLFGWSTSTNILDNNSVIAECDTQIKLWVPIPHYTRGKSPKRRKKGLPF